MATVDQSKSSLQITQEKEKTLETNVDEKDSTKLSKNAAKLNLIILLLIITYLAQLGLGGYNDAFKSLDFIFRGFMPVVFLPIIMAMAVFYYMMKFSDHENIYKSRFKISKHISITDNRFGKWLVRRRWFQASMIIPLGIPMILVIIFGLYGYGGYIGRQDAAFVNGATFLTWNIWWVGMIFTFPLFGRVWCTICPLGAIGEWTHRTRPPKDVTFMGYIIRTTMAGSLAIFGFILFGLTFALIFLGFDVETLAGPISDISANPIIELIVYYIKMPFYIFLAMIDFLIIEPSPVKIIIFIIWSVIALSGLFIFGTLGFLIKEFFVAMLVGTPLRQEEDPKRPYPQRYRFLWISSFLFVGTMIFDFAVGMFVSPIFTALFLILLIVISSIMGMIYERRAFCQYICPLACIIGSYGSTGILALRNKDMAVCSKCKTKDCLKGRTVEKGTSAISPDKEVEFDWGAGYACPMGEYPMIMESNLGCIMCTECLKSCRNDNIHIVLQPPSMDLYVKKKKRFDEAGLAAILIGITLALILPGAPEIAAFMDFIKSQIVIGIFNVPDIVFGIPMSQYITLIIWFIIGAIIMPIGLLFFAAWMSKIFGKTKGKSTKDLFIIFAYAILPLGLVTHLSYWVVRLMEHGLGTLSILADPFANEFMGFTIYNAQGVIDFSNPLLFPVAIVYAINPLFYLIFDPEIGGMSHFPALFTLDFIFFFRIFVVLLGLSYSIFAIYKTAIRNFGKKSRSQAIRVAIPFVTFTVIFTMLVLFSARSWAA